MDLLCDIRFNFESDFGRESVGSSGCQRGEVVQLCTARVCKMCLVWDSTRDHWESLVVKLEESSRSEPL